MGRLAFLLFVCLKTLATVQAAERVSWTSSRLHGSPEPPAAYSVERAFPRLTFKEPLAVAMIPGTQRLVVIEHKGQLFSFPNDENCEKADLFANLHEYGREAAEFYSLAFHPRFAENRYVFVWINFDTNNKPNRENGTHIVRFRVTDEPIPKLDLTSGTLILSWLAGGHNGGDLCFGPDGMLYISAGDASVPDPPDIFATGQDLSDLLASVLRIDVDHTEAGQAYRIPKDNPFVNTPHARGEVWAYGFRNPWRMSFDSKTGDLWVGDVGWELWEMIYRVQRGGNYGWSITEGGRQDVRPDRPRGPTPILPPIVTHSHEEAASITGGYVYHGKKLPALEGAYVYGDWQTGGFWSLRMKGNRVVEHRSLCHTTLSPVGFGITANQELLICDFGGGGLWRLVKNSAAWDPAQFPRKLSETGLFADVTKETPAPGVVPYKVNAERWADHARAQRWVALPKTSTISRATKSLGVLPSGRWDFPTDAVLAKTYSLEMERGKPESLRRIETQVLHYDGVQWSAYSYRWNQTQTDAELVAGGGAEATFPIKDPGVPSGVRQQTWHFFSRTECLRCHNQWNNFTPGYSALQLRNTTQNEPDDQLNLLRELGLAPKESGSAKLIVNTDSTVEQRARAWLHINCSVCHRYGGGGSVPSVMNIEAPLKSAHLLGTKPVQGDLGLPDARTIAPHDPCRSALLYRMTTGGRGHMPYLGGKLLDDQGILLVRDWIASLPTQENDTSPAVQAQRETEGKALLQLKGGDAAPLDALLSTPSGALSVALAVLDGSLNQTLREQAIRRGSALSDPLRRDLFERFLPEEKRRKVLGAHFDPKTVFGLKGNLERGQKQFLATCSVCHRTANEGRDFGPDLSHIAKKYDRAGLLEQIVKPSKTIEPQWYLTTVTLKDGESESGFLLSQTADGVKLKIAGGEIHQLPSQQIAKTVTERVSVMPEGLLDGLTGQEAADLLEFLKSLK